MVSGEFPEQASDPTITQRKSLPESEDEVDQQLLIHLAKEGGVKFLLKPMTAGVPGFNINN